ncbi:MAG: SGNH/GDSL hydrolase family protein [Verrucomicrobiota bacterium]
MKPRLNQIIFIRKLTLLAALLVVPIESARAADRPVQQFQKGDTVCFVGDSITHNGSYHGQILLFYATRFPDRRFESYNCGISGDSAAGTVNRYAWDIAPRKPKVATIMLGMNDVGRDNYSKDQTAPEFAARRQRSLDLYATNMLKLTQTLADAGCRLIFITPSIYDQTGNQKTTNHYGVNDALARCAKIGGELAEQFHGGVVDFHSIMKKVNEEGQKTNPSFTIVGEDRVHPGNPGHMLMAYTFLKAQEVPALVSKIKVDAVKGSALEQENCKVTGIKAATGSISFTGKENALPFPIADDVRKSLERFIPLTSDLDREILAISGLPAGRYEVLIDGKAVQTNSAAELGTGVNLALNTNTPQYKQAQAVADLIWKRHGLVQNLRTVAAVRHFVLSRANIKAGDLAAENKALDEQREKNRKANFAYGNYQIDTYRKFSGSAPQIEKQAAELWDQVFAANQPRPHAYEVRRQ